LSAKTGGFESDGGISIGYGHWISEGEYISDPDEKSLIDTYAPGASLIPSYIPSNGVTYAVPGTSYVPIDIVLNLKRNDVVEYEEKLNEFITTNNLSFEQNQYDMLISLSYQYGKNIWTNHTTFPNYLIESNGNYDSKTIESMFNLYGGGEGGNYENRRRTEYSIFNNGY